MYKQKEEEEGRGKNIKAKRFNVYDKIRLLQNYFAFIIFTKKKIVIYLKKKEINAKYEYKINFNANVSACFESNCLTTFRVLFIMRYNYIC